VVALVEQQAQPAVLVGLAALMAAAAAAVAPVLRPGAMAASAGPAS